jgi:hypothetical protein
LSGLGGVSQVRLDPGQVSLEKNGTQTVYVTVIYHDSGGYQLRDGSQAAFVMTDPTIASVNPSGVVTALKVGSTVLTVTVGAATQTATVTVF